MADDSHFLNYDGWHADIEEWFDHDGKYHYGQPTAEQMLNDAVEMVVHAHGDDGNDVYFTRFSPDGWEYDEIEGEVDDSYQHYTEPGK